MPRNGRAILERAQRCSLFCRTQPDRSVSNRVKTFLQAHSIRNHAVRGRRMGVAGCSQFLEPSLTCAMAVVLMEAAQAPGWFICVVEDMHAIKLVPGRHLASELSISEFDTDGDGGLRIQSGSGALFTLLLVASEASPVCQLACERGGRGSVFHTLSSSETLPDAAGAGAVTSSSLPTWVTGEVEFALKSADQEGIFVGNVPESPTCHAVVGVDTRLGASPLLLRCHCVHTIPTSPSVAEGTASVEAPPLSPLGDWVKLSASDSPPAPAAAASTWHDAAALIARAIAGLASPASSLASFASAGATGLGRMGSNPRSAKGRAREGGLRSDIHRWRHPKHAALADSTPVALDKTAAGAGADSAASGAAADSAPAALDETASGAGADTTAAALEVATPSALVDATHRGIPPEGRAEAAAVGVPWPPADPAGSALACPLSPAQLATFASEGYVVIEDVIPPALLEAAMRAINASIGQLATQAKVFSNKSSRSVPASEQAGSIGTSAPIVALAWQTRAWGAANSLLGAGMVQPPGGAQVALRFPQPPGAELRAGGPRQGRASHWHIDGMDRDRFAPFSLLCGVMLSDTLEADMGQLIVYPRTHLMLAERIRREGAAWVSQAAPRPSLGDIEPVQLRARAGSIVLAHPLLAHRIGLNFSSSIRYAAFFRFRSERHEELRKRLPRHPLAMYPPLNAK